LKRFLLLLAILLALAGLTLHQTQLPLYLWYQWQLAGRELPPQAVGLGGYRVDIDALVLEGVEDDLSALTYNAERDTLFALLNGDPYLLELSLDGEVLRRVHLTGLQDMEGLTHVGGNRYVVVEEQRQRLHLIELPEAATELDLSQAPQLTVAMDEGDNKGFEGLSWDSKRQQLLVVRERDPLRVLVIEGFVTDDGQGNISISEKSLFNQQTLQLSDLSSVVADETSGHLLLLSDESRMVVEYDQQGVPVSMLGLRRGSHGLARSIPQAEGLAIDSQRRVYIASEPNLFYRFVPEGSSQD
jgi:uncharacterized protein YjiK